jgi:putative endonuclease
MVQGIPEDSGYRNAGHRNAALRDLGDRGEQAVALWYEGEGFSVLARNWRTKSGEIDVIVRKGDLVVVCEVKTRTSSRFGTPFEAVTPQKARRLRRLAGQWLSEARRSGQIAGGTGVDVRFDVASVTVERGRLVVEVMDGAF